MNVKSILFISDVSDNYYIDRIATFFRYLGIMVDKITLDFVGADTRKGDYDYIFSLMPLSKGFRRLFTTENFYYTNDLEISENFEDSLKWVCGIIFNDYDLSNVINLYTKNDHYIDNQIFEYTDFFKDNEEQQLKIIHKRDDMIDELQEILKEYENTTMEPYLVYFINALKIDLNCICWETDRNPWYYPDRIISNMEKYVKDYPIFHWLYARTYMIDSSYRNLIDQEVISAIDLKKAPFSSYFMLEKRLMQSIGKSYSYNFLIKMRNFLISNKFFSELPLASDDYFASVSVSAGEFAKGLISCSDYFYLTRLFYAYYICCSSKERVTQANAIIDTLLSIGEISSLNLGELKYLFAGFRLLRDSVYSSEEKDEIRAIFNNNIDKCRKTNQILSELSNNHQENGYYGSAIKTLNAAIDGKWPHDDIDIIKERKKRLQY